jgi:hypothetical protein
MARGGLMGKARGGGAIAAAAVLLLIAAGAPALAEGKIIVENRSVRTIKMAAPGGSAVVEPGSPPVTVSFTSDEPVGLTVQIWWTAQPRQLCRIFAPWDRTITVTGDAVIVCLSQ